MNFGEKTLYDSITYKTFTYEIIYLKHEISSFESIWENLNSKLTIKLLQWNKNFNQ